MNTAYLIITVAVGIAAYCMGRSDGRAAGLAERDDDYERIIASLEAEVKARVLPPMSGRLQWHREDSTAKSIETPKFVRFAREAGIAVGGRG